MEKKKDLTRRVSVTLIFSLVLSQWGCKKEDEIVTTAPLAVSAPQPDKTGLLAWFHSSSITGVADGEKVHLWNDSSGNDASLIQSNIANQPLLKKGSNGLANHPVVSFDRLDSHQLVGKVEGMSGLTRLTLSAVIRTNDTTEATPIGAIDWGMHFNLVIGGASVGKVLAVFDGDTANNLEGHLSEASINDGEGQIVTMSSDGNKTRLFINGLDESVYGETLSVPTEDFAVGNQFGTSRYFSGDIAEIVIYDRKLELEDRLALECIFADKFKISIAQPCN